MRSTTENSIISEINRLRLSHLVCTGQYPNVQLSDCATAALRDFIDIYICHKTVTWGVNYQHLLGILKIIILDDNVMSQSDNMIWSNYRTQNTNAPPSSHQLPGLAKALIKGKFYQ
jgi:hypothetical protein